MTIGCTPEENPRLPVDLDENLKRAAHHEAGHMAVAAVEGLRLRHEGLSVDPRADGIACYCKLPDGSDSSRKRIIVATFAGFCAEKRLCEENSYTPPDPANLWMACDEFEARKLLSEISSVNLLNASLVQTQDQLRSRSAYLIEQHWRAIVMLASALLAKDWEPLKPLKSGARWSHEATAKCIAGDEVASILMGCGIPASCEPGS